MIGKKLAVEDIKFVVDKDASSSAKAEDPVLVLGHQLNAPFHHFQEEAVGCTGNAGIC